MARIDPQVLAHLEWMGFVQPTGLVVSAPALVRAGAILDRRDSEGQRLLRSSLAERTFDPKDGPAPWLPDFRAFASAVLGWSFSPKAYAGTSESPIPAELLAPVPGHDETLRPDFAVRELDPQAGASGWQLLVQVLEPGEDLDRVVRTGGGLEASPHGRLERLLRHTNVPAGLLFNGRVLRLVSAPRGESSGWVDFAVEDMVQTAGRPISTALRLLLSEQRLLALPRQQRLAALLSDSRKFQNEVSEQLAKQVLHALYELLRGFQAAHDASGGALLREALDDHPDEVYRGLLTVILRLVFLLYAEERDMLPEDEAFLRYYSLAGLHERLRSDAALYPDTMDQRFGAWAQLVVLFRMLHDGAESGPMKLPRRHGVLFDPNRFPFLEGRPMSGGRQIHERVEPPLVPDGTIYRALEKLLVLDGERISYRALDVEEIGSVYQAMMGFRLETATGRSIAIKAQKKWSAPTTVSLEALLAVKVSERKKWLEEQAARKVPDGVTRALKEAETLDDLHAALSALIDRDATPDIVPEGAMVLQPSEERRRSGSHYTPRALTEPIVRTTLEPILARLRGADGKAPRPEQILDLKVCDPAMGSGAFLVETCRQLGEALVEAWHAHGALPVIPPDEDERIHARRLVAQRCLYGVDRNPIAVDLAKVSLWLATLAKDHPLTFLDHALRHGDSLVGLSRQQIEAFHWDANAPAFQAGIETVRIRDHLKNFSNLRAQIRGAGDDTFDFVLRDLWDEAQRETAEVRFLGDLAVAAFFDGDNAKQRLVKRAEYGNAIVTRETRALRDNLEERRRADPPLVPFHWELEFPEVFERERPGFDAFVGNPPFLGGTLIGSRLGLRYHDYVVALHAPATGLADLVAFFLRRSFDLVREDGTCGFIATNTVAQGDTRSTGLEALLASGASIYQAYKRYQWPGDAAVVVSVVFLRKGDVLPDPVLDGKPVERISAFLLTGSADATPKALASNRNVCFRGTKIWGSGFVFEESPSNGSSSLEDMRRLLEANPRNQEVVFAYLGGEEFNSSPTQSPSRFVIDFGARPREEAEKWKELFALVEERVRPVRANNKQRNYREQWWLHANRVEEAAPYLQRNGKLLTLSCVSQHLALAFVRAGTVVQDRMMMLLLSGDGDFAVLQSRLHETWARVIGTTLEDTLSYTTVCFDTFPLPMVSSRALLGDVGAQYYAFRAELMRANDQGLTTTYNRFHDPAERDPGILRLRELHAAMDRAVLDAYGWTDIPNECEFLLDYEIDEEEWGDKKKPWRYRWPDDVRDEVLARLLELNAERAKEETRSGAATDVTPKSAPKKRANTAAPKNGGAAPKARKNATTTKSKKTKPPDSGDLFS
ncbi:Eco57I restriction-modification methylase domain-containing protein [Anaeromyxobacter oryzae]|uniref:site-specific DNA-methyltransferase (adenine-specific) n=1 Tax=Anaeromyxobacter oryzae TaxID=2918170 RepID=A0ABM7WTK8_9BACT|nr:DNA methyltransferase [Anaeromyxobacter oryzae]BDG02822.1 hypothetical protein AMOR_18180 [Anaeromyxobacter oryzae]